MELLSLGSKGSTFSTLEFGFYSPLSIALFSVLLHAGSHGLSVCEALKKLVRQGYSKLLNSDAHTRAIQVKSALRSCPAFKEIEGKRFVLRFNRQNDCTISPTRLCKRGKVCGEKHRKINKDCIDNKGPCNRPTAAIERGLGVQGPCKQARIVQVEDMHLVGSCNKDRLPHIDPMTTFDAPTNDNICTQPLDDKKHESIQSCCPLDPKHCGCIQHTCLGSLYSDCVNQSGREDIKGSAFALESKDSGKVLCHFKDTNREDKLQLGRCSRTDGKRWRCPKKVQPGSIYCEHHHIMRRGGYKAKVVDAIKAGETSPSIRPSEALSVKCVPKEEEGLCFEPLKLANRSSHVSTAQPVATSCKLFVKEELNEAQCETKPFLHTLESHNLEDAWRSKTEEKLAGPRQSVMAMAAMQEGHKEKPPVPHILEEERHEEKEETKQYLHRLGVHEHEDVERSKKEANSTGHGQSIIIERTIYEGQQKAKPDLNSVEKEVVPKVSGEKGEHHHLRGTKARAEGLEKVGRADVASWLQASIIPFKVLTDKDVDREEEKDSVKPSRLATGPFGGSVAQVVTSSSDILVEEKFHKVHKEMRPFIPRLELIDLEGVQRLKKKPKFIGHGQSVLLEGQEETKPDQHVLEKLRYEVKQKTTPKLHAVVTHILEDGRTPNEAPRLLGHGQMITPEKTVHEDQETAKLDSPVPASDGLNHMQVSQEDSMSGFYRTSMLPHLKKEVSYNTSEDGTEMYRGKGFHIEPSNLTAKMQVAAMPLSSSQNPKRRLLDQGDSSPSRHALFLDASLHLSNENQSPRVSTDLSGQCHRKDGKGWQCSRQCKPGCIYCEHHQGRLSRSSTNGKKKMILQLELDKHVLATCLKGGSETQVLRVAIDVPETLVKGLKTKVSHCTGRPPEGTTAAEGNDALRCHRKDGKGWQCAQQCKHGSIYCDRHQRQQSKSRFACVHSQHKLSSGLEYALKPHLKSQEVEIRSGKQDDLGLASLSLGTPARAFHGSCLWEAKTSEQVSKAENTPKKCHRRDGKKWQCSRLCMPGYNHCEHHQGRGRKVKVKT